ncbi:Mucin-5AC-like protein [Hirschfeldia incana]|nr:Mucin-5AC-like protein [Hirschfeldia incana]
MNDRSLKKSLSGKSNSPADDFVVGDADENSDLFSVNRTALTSLDGRRSFEQAKVAKPELDDEKELWNDQLKYTVPEVTLEALSKLVLQARNVTSKLQSISTTRAAGTKSESDPSSKPTRSTSTGRPSNIPTLRPSSIPTLRPSNTVRSSSAPKKTATTASASVASPKKNVSRSLTPVSRKTPSRSSTPSRISTTTPSFKKSGDAQRSRSLTPRSKPQTAAATSAAPSSRTSTVRSTSASSRPSVSSSTPQTPPRGREKTVTLAFGRPVATTRNVTSPKRNTSPGVTRTRHKEQSASSSSLIPSFSGVGQTTAREKSVKSSATVSDPTRPGKKVSKASVQIANNHMDARKGKANPFLGTMLYPQSIKSYSRKWCGSSEGSSSSNQEEDEGKSLMKEENTEKSDSARYESLLDVKDVKDTNWLLNLDDESNHSLIFDSVFDSPPEPFSPL